MKEYKILHVEDSASDVELVQRVLKKGSINYKYLIVDDREKFIAGLKNFNPDVILCDHSLPQFDSITAFEIYKEMNFEIAFLLVTGSVSEEYAVEMMRKGIDDYLLKENLQRLPQAIRNAFAKREKEKLRKLAEEKLAQSEMLLNKAQQIAHIGSLEVDVETRKEIWSNEIFRILGLSPEDCEPSQETLLSFIHPEDLGFVKNNVEQARKELRDMSFYNRIIRKDGITRQIHFESKFEFDKQGKPVKINGIIHDITEKVLADQQKEFDSQNLSALINNTSDLMWSVDRNFNLITANEGFDNIIKRMIGKTITKGSNVFPTGFDKDQLARFKQFYERAFLGETFTVIEYTDEMCAEISFYPICKEKEVIGTACYSRDITESKRIEQEILSKNEQLKNLTSHLQRVREEERTTISREIHDELGQQLTALKMDIDWIMHKQNNPDEKVMLKLKDMLQMSDGIISTIRRISSDLRPAIIDDLGLIAALEWKCTDFEEKMGIPCRFISNVKERRFDNQFGINTYRILQETLTNVGRHAEAKSVTVSVSENETDLFLEIADDGKGIPPDRMENGKTLGILGMKERAALLGGTLTIENGKNKGTLTKLTLPLNDEHTNS
ncbi:MAG TPA: PAS domain-containing protein [Bacteroidia bacterium]|nr:PAS domain-containing protein [Bacteroidia bacterium]